jgi:hypothetical protein
MKSNLGSYDVAVRFVSGCVILLIGTHHESVWGLLGLIPLATALMAFCPLYCVVRVDTTFTDRP